MNHRRAAMALAAICLATACGSTRPESEDVAALGSADLEGFTGGVGGATASTGGSAQEQSGSGTSGSAGGPSAAGPAGGGQGGTVAADAGAGVGGDVPAGGEAGAGAGGPNTASDVGVTETSIRVGNIVSRGGPLGPNQFTPAFYGANAYFEDLNARGGVNGRTIEFLTCDDREESGQNRQCAESLVGQDVFAFVANASRVHFGGAGLIDSSGTPDVGGEAIGYEYFKYSHLFPLYSHVFGHYPRNGTTGWDGTLSQGDGPYRWVADQGVQTAAVLYYSIPISKSEGLNMAAGLRRHGVEVIEFELNPALPGFDSIVARMRAEGVQAIVNSIDNTGNQNLCTSLDRAGYEVQIHMLTVAGWTRGVGENFSTPCRTNLYSFGWSLPASETSNPEVARFREVTAQIYGAEFPGIQHQWAFEGWVAAKQFTEAVASMGPNVTREGLMAWYRGLRDYDSGGLLTPGDYEPFQPTDGATVPNCFSVVRWDEGLGDFAMVEPPSHCVEGTWGTFSPVYEP